MSSEFLREEDRTSILAFLLSSMPYIKGDVLDLGCGKQPYRWYIENMPGVKSYYGYDRPDWPGSVVTEEIGDGEYAGAYKAWDTIIMTQVAQYIGFDQVYCGGILRSMIKRGGHLVMTYPTHWPEVEKEDLLRFTKSGMEDILRRSGFVIERHDLRLSARLADFDEEIAIGYGVVARAFID